MKVADNIMTDNDGNFIRVHDTKETRIISLKLKTETKERLIGTLSKINRELIVTRIRAKHLMLKSNSYGFNYHVLSKAKQFDHVRLEDDHAAFLIPVSFILEKGKFLFFKQQGFEKQIFISLKEIEQFKTTSML